MTRNRQLVVVLFLAFLIAATGSHLLVAWVNVRTRAVQATTVGKANGKPPAFLAGSSLAGYGISWEQISTQLDLEIKTWGIAGGSPCEWEQFQDKVPDAKTTFIVVSAYDLNEGIVCDFRAELVPLGHTIKILRTIDADWDYTKRSLSQYPIAWFRTLFPTLGRSRGIMGNLRIKALKLIKPSARISEAEAGPTLEFGKATEDDVYKKQRISDWSESEIVRKTSAMRAGIQENQSFHGPKMLAFEGMLQRADPKGRTLVVVLPVSPIYAKGFMPPEFVQEFETALAGLQRKVPRAEWLRLDQAAGLASDENFCDLVHMNYHGQKIATQALRARLSSPASQP